MEEEERNWKGKRKMKREFCTWRIERKRISIYCVEEGILVFNVGKGRGRFVFDVWRGRGRFHIWCVERKRKIHTWCVERKRKVHIWCVERKRRVSYLMCGEEVCVFTPWMLWIPLLSELCEECLDIWEELGRNKTLSLRVEGGGSRSGGIFTRISLVSGKAHAPLSHF